MLTINNPKANADTKIEDLHATGKIVYAAWQLEIGEEGTVHYQIFLSFKNNIKFDTLKNMYPRAHIEVAYDVTAARKYCNKEDTRLEGPFQIGTFINNMNKWESIRDDIKEGKMDDVAFADKYPSHVGMYLKGIRNLQTIYAKARNEKPEVIVLTGKPGCGKSRYCHEKSPNGYWKQPSSIWWDYYDGKQDVILDDFYGGIQYSELLRILDRYPLLVQTKGGNSNMNSKKIFITSNKSPREWYSNLFEGHKGDYTALARRITSWLVYSDVDNKFDEMKDELLTAEEKANM